MEITAYSQKAVISIATGEATVSEAEKEQKDWAVILYDCKLVSVSKGRIFKK